MKQFKDILIHIDESRQCAARVELAVSIAREHEAHLTGIFIVTHSPYASQSDARKEAMARAERLFQEKSAEAGIEATWLPVDWRTVGVEMAQILNYHAYTKDLVIVGQAGPGMEATEVPADLPERVVAGSGRPVLVVPFAGNFGGIGKTVAVAWKAGRASARAINDAMPFLESAAEVFALSIRGGEGHGETEKDESGIAANLRRHGVNAKEVAIFMESIPVGKVLMDFAWETGCDLMVLGVNVAHSRGKQDVGPVAREFFDNMTLPVLMSS